MIAVATALQPLRALFDGAHVGIWGFRAEGVAALTFLRRFEPASVTIVDDALFVIQRSMIGPMRSPERS